MFSLNFLFVIYALITIPFLISYFYFLFFQKGRHRGDKELEDIPTSFMLNRTSKAWWMWLTTPVERFLLAKKIHPTTISYWALGLSGLACLGYGLGWFAFAGWFVVLAGTCDMFDGRIARKQNVTTKTGEFLDSNVDRWSESLWYLGLFNYYANTLFFYIVFLAFISAFMVSYVKARGESLSVYGKIGTMQRSERIVWLGATSVLSPLFSAITNYFFPVSTTFLASFGITVIAFLTCYTYYERYQFISQKLK